MFVSFIGATPMNPGSKSTSDRRQWHQMSSKPQLSCTLITRSKNTKRPPPTSFTGITSGCGTRGQSALSLKVTLEDTCIELKVINIPSPLPLVCHQLYGLQILFVQIVISAPDVTVQRIINSVTFVSFSFQLALSDFSREHLHMVCSPKILFNFPTGCE